MKRHHVRLVRVDDTGKRVEVRQGGALLGTLSLVGNEWLARLADGTPVGYPTRTRAAAAAELVIEAERRTHPPDNRG